MTTKKTRRKSKTAKPAKRTPGAPTKFTAALTDEVCRRMADGESLRSICRGDHMPPESTVRGWAVDDQKGFAERYARARGMHADALFDEALEIADDVLAPRFNGPNSRPPGRDELPGHLKVGRRGPHAIGSPDGTRSPSTWGRGCARAFRWGARRWRQCVKSGTPSGTSPPFVRGETVSPFMCVGCTLGVSSYSASSMASRRARRVARCKWSGGRSFSLLLPRGSRWSRPMVWRSRPIRSFSAAARERAALAWASKFLALVVGNSGFSNILFASCHSVRAREEVSGDEERRPFLGQKRLNNSV